MSKNSSVPVLAGLTFVLLAPTACTNYEPVKASKCGEVVNHTSKILGKLAKPKATMLKECKNFTDEQRGCAMQASIVADLVKCAKL